MYTGVNYIEEIKAKYNILDLVKDIGLQTNGSNFICSIYKQEGTPSLKLYPKTNTYKCYATGLSGDIIQFYSDYYKIEAKQSIKELAKKLNISNQNYDRSNSGSGFKTISTKKYELLKTEREFFEERTSIIMADSEISVEDAKELAFKSLLEQRSQLQIKVYEDLYTYSNNIGLEQAILDYLLSDKRGLDEETIKHFRLFSINSVNQTIEFLKDTFTRDEIILSGVFKTKYFLFTKHRLIIPFIENNNISYLRARYFYKGSFQTDKFKYTSVNNWSKTLSPKRFYNIDLIQTLKPFDNILITEGEFDCMVANKAGSNAVGIAGTGNFPKDQINLLNNFNVYLCFDSDTAGKKAAYEISELFNKQVHIINLDGYKDITELLNEN